MKVELIIDRDCPNVQATRDMLSQALSAAGYAPEWTEWDRGAARSPAYVRRYGSPTVLVDRQDVSGNGSQSDANCCRVYRDPDGGFRGVPSQASIMAALEAAK